MAKNGIDLLNIKEFEKFFDALPDTLARRVQKQALIASAKPIKTRMKEKLSRHVRTGTLRKSIAAKSAKRGRRGKQEVVVLVGAHKANNVNFIRDGFYARFLEFGTSKQPPRAWAKPSVDETHSAQRKELAREYGTRGLREIKRQARKFIGTHRGR